MSSSYIIEPQEGGSEKKDDTLIIVVNDDGTISVDQETLQNLIMNQSNANVSVVRLGQGEADAGNGEITLTVDPPMFTPSAVTSAGTTTTPDASSLVDPFMEMDPEQLERLETALQSEEAKQILGENVTAMLDMLSVEEQQNNIRYSVELDHCYTSRLSPSDPKPRDPLPVVHSPASNDLQQYGQVSSPPVRTMSAISSPVNEADNELANKPKTLTKTGKPVGRPRKTPITSVATPLSGSSRSLGNTAGMQKPLNQAAPRNLMNTMQHGVNKGNGRNIEEDEEDELSSSESSESEPPSDNDSDFGPRGPRRGGVRARGGRKGITTRGGSMTGARRRGPNKQLDMEQVRRLDMEMAAAVNAMKSPEKEDKSGRFSPIKGKRQLKTLGGRKREEATHSQTLATTDELPYEKPLQTTNQVKANLISANMVKGDMILTKPGQGRNNQKVTFIQKQVLMKPGEFKPVGIKKQVILPKVPANTSPPATTKETSPQIDSIVQQSMQPQNQIVHQQQPKPALTSPLKLKIQDIKKEKKKPDGVNDLHGKGEIDAGKAVVSAEVKGLDNAKKHLKKEARKSPGYVADTLGPALFSTPDIIRRVGSTDSKAPDTPTTPLTPPASTANASNASGAMNVTSNANVTPRLSTVGQVTSTMGVTSPNTPQNAISTIPNKSIEEAAQPEKHLSTEAESNTIASNEAGKKLDVRAPLADDLHPSLDSGVLEGEEHLLATLEMEANKHEEELLAEALLLQEELGVDLGDHPVLTDPTPAVSESLTSSNTLISPMITSEQEPVKGITNAGQVSANIPRESAKKPSTSQEKEPIQIVRGGRVITLPPIEAPATRSKRLQAKSETTQKMTMDYGKKTEKITIQTQQQQQQQQLAKEELHLDMNEDEDDDEEDDEEDEDNSDSEDDPDRLWCICKRPHNNRFMICCDVCEDWFHGKCVHVSKAMGQQMEEKGIEWVCPNCLKKKSDDGKAKLNSQPILTKQRSRSEQSSEASTSPRQMTSQIVSPTDEISSSIPLTSADAMQFPGTTQCVVCKKEARNSSIYCSDACILAHAQETLTKDKPALPLPNSKALKSPTLEAKLTQDARVIVFERKTGKVLTGSDAPLRSNLKNWLKENPTFEVVRPSSFNTVQIGGKTVTTIQTQIPKTGKSPQVAPTRVQTLPKMIYAKVAGSKQTVLAPSSKKIVVVPAGQIQTSTGGVKATVKQTIITTAGKSPVILKQASPKIVTPSQTKTQVTTVQKQTPVKKQEVKVVAPQPKQQIKPSLPKKPETEPIRLNIRKTLAELLSSRIRETEDLKLTEEEIADLAFNIELEMYKYFKDTGAKYKAKYRSLVFNIKDTKNLTLFRKIADRSLTPDAVVRLSPDEMASQELAEWREKETKHQLEMIKKNELDLMAQAKSIVVKTHKGEQIIENDGGIGHVDPKTPVQDIVTALNSGDSISSTVEDSLDKPEDKAKTKMESKKLRGGDEKRKKDKERDRERDRRSRSSKERRDRSSSRDRSKSRRSRDRERDRDRSKARDRSRERKSTRKESRREKENKEREKERERGEKLKINQREKDKERGREREKERHKCRESRSRNRSESSHRDSPRGGSRDKKDEERRKEADKKKDHTPPPMEKPNIDDRLWRHIEDETTTNTIDGNDSDVSDREPSSTVTIKTPDINEEVEKDRDRDREQETEKEREKDREVAPKGSWQTVWRGFVNMVDVAKFFITAQEVSGNAKDLMDDLPDTVDVVGRISHETVWDYISKMKRTGSKEILVIRLTAANDEEKIPYITLYSYLNSRSRLGVVGNVSKNIKDFYIMPFSNQSKIPQVLLPLSGPGFEEHRPHLLLGIIVRNKRKRLSAIPASVPSKVSKKDTDRSYTPPLVNPKEKSITSSPPASSSPHLNYHKSANDAKEKQVTQMTLDSLNKAHIGMRNVIDSATICKIVPELSSKIDLTSSPSKVTLDDDGDEPYSPGEMDEEMRTGSSNSTQTTTNENSILSSNKNSNELQRKMDELNRQIEEQKQQIQNISSSFLGETTPTLPGLGLDPPSVSESDEAYSPSDTRSFTPPPPVSGISKFAQPILDKVSDITIPPNLQEILANVKRQESSKVDPYLPSKPSATFLTTINSSMYQNSEKYSSASHNKSHASTKLTPEKPANASPQPSTSKEGSKSTLSTLSDLDLIRKAEEELAAVAAATAATNVPSVAPSSPAVTPTDAMPVLNPKVLPAANTATELPAARSPVSPDLSTPPPPLPSTPSLLMPTIQSNVEPGTFAPKKTVPASLEQPKPPGLEDEDFPSFPSTPPTMNTLSPIDSSRNSPRSKFVPKSGVVLSVKRKVSDDSSSLSPSKAPRTKSRWGQGPSE